MRTVTCGGLACVAASLLGCIHVHAAPPLPCIPYRDSPTRVAEFKQMLDEQRFPETRRWIRLLDAKCVAEMSQIR